MHNLKRHKFDWPELQNVLELIHKDVYKRRELERRRDTEDSESDDNIEGNNNKENG